MNLTLCINLKNFALTQFGGDFDFNSFAQSEGKYFGANKNGIFELEKPNSTELIESFFQLAQTDFGVSNQKRIRAVVIGGEANGPIRVRGIAGERYESSGIMRLSSEEMKQGTGMCCLERGGRIGGRDRYWKLRIENVDFSKFCVDSVSVTLTLLSSRTANYRSEELNEQDS